MEDAFATHGYVVVNNVFSASQIAQLQLECKQLLDEIKCEQLIEDVGDYCEIIMLWNTMVIGLCFGYLFKCEHGI